MTQHQPFTFSTALAALCLTASVLTPSAQANVYATNIKLNGGRTNLTVAQDSPVAISYILNEPASLGVSIKVLSGTNTLKTLTLPAESAGALRGTNTVVWNGRDETDRAAAAGTYRVSIAAAAQGYTNWAPITTGGQDTAIWAAYGITVDQNTNSPYYGRIFIANAHDGSNPAVDGYNTGIVKRNADASPADEGGFSTGGYTWGDNYVSPWKVKVSDDDNTYVADRMSGSLVMRWNPWFSLGSELNVLRADNWTNGPSLTGFAITGSGTNTELWAADNGIPSRGIVRWTLGPDGACVTNDTGATVIGLGSGTNLTLAPYDVAIDRQGNIYTCQRPENAADPAARVLCFAPSASPTNSVAKWAIGGQNTRYSGAAGLALDGTGTYLAVAFEGYDVFGFPMDGSTRVFYATNGALAADVDFGRVLDGFDIHSDTDCAWDSAGNLYCIDNLIGYWRAFSPPGTNQATTVAPQQLQILGPPELRLSSIAVSGGTVTMSFTSQPGDSASIFKLLSAATASGSYTEAANSAITQASPGVFTATVPTDGPARFYRIQKN